MRMSILQARMSLSPRCGVAFVHRRRIQRRCHIRQTECKNHREIHSTSVVDAPVSQGSTAGTRSSLRGAWAETTRNSLFPFSGRFVLEQTGTEVSPELLCTVLSKQLSQERTQRIQAAVNQRSFSVLPVVCGAYDLGNVSAVARSCEAFGFGGLDVVAEKNSTYKQTGRTSSGAAKWLHMNWYEDTASAFAALRSRGYNRILVADASPENNPTMVHDLDFTIPTALCFGNERGGLPDEAMRQCDGCVAVDTRGLVESLNVSVAAAVMLHAAHRDREREGSRCGDLTSEQKRILQAVLMLRAVQGASRKAGSRFLEELLKREQQLEGMEPDEFHGAKHKLKTSI